jgi:osmotically-inducible protein OsmY
MTLEAPEQPVDISDAPRPERGSKPWLPLTLAALVPLAACSSPPPSAPEPAVTQLEGVANDALLTTEVKAKLITVDIDSTATLGVHVSGGVATLSGAVRTQAARERTVAAAKSVRGIRVVHDELHVDPHVPDVRARVGDAALAGRIAAAIFTQTGSTAVRVDVHTGVVTLRGSVTDPKLRDAAVDTARNTTGVTSVVDDMGGLAP